MDDDAQKAQQVVALMEKLFRDRPLKDVLAGPLAKAVLGPLPPYSNREDYHIYSCTTLTAAAGTVIYSIDRTRMDPVTGRKGEPMIVLIERPDEYKGQKQLGCVGGFLNLDYAVINGVKEDSRGEYPEETAAREIHEELVDDQGQPVLPVDDLTQFKPIVADIDYRRSKSPACAFTAFRLEISRDEMQALKAHSQKMATDENYRQAVVRASKGEVENVIIMPLSEAVKLDASRFTHPHELAAIQQFEKDFHAKGAARRLSS